MQRQRECHVSSTATRAVGHSECQACDFEQVPTEVNFIVPVVGGQSCDRSEDHFDFDHGPNFRECVHAAAVNQFHAVIILISSVSEAEVDGCELGTNWHNHL